MTNIIGTDFCILMPRSHLHINLSRNSHAMRFSRKKGGTPAGGGGGGDTPPQILVGIRRGTVKNGPGLRIELHGRAWKCGAPDRAWAVTSVKMRGSGPWNAGLRNCQDASGWHSGRLLTRARAEPAVGSDERLEIKEILKVMVSGTAKNVKWWCSGPSDSLVILWKLYAPERKVRT